MRNRAVELYLLSGTDWQGSNGNVDEAAMLAAAGVAESPALHQLVAAHGALVSQAQAVHRWSFKLGALPLLYKCLLSLGAHFAGIARSHC